MRLNDKGFDVILNATDAELEPYVTLIKDQLTEGLTQKTAYKKNFPQHSKYAPDIVEELQLFGGNSILNQFRGHGVLSSEIIYDVADKLDVPYKPEDSIELIKEGILWNLWCKALYRMSPADREKCIRDFGMQNSGISFVPLGNAAAMTAFKLGGFQSYQLAVIIANSVWKHLFNKGLTFAANSTLTKALSTWAGPLGWAITLTWATIDIAGPAYRVTIPAVIYTIMLERKRKYSIKPKAGIVNRVQGWLNWSKE
jgi:uncharacterized protein YaaW (UPF0174 family)